VVESAPLLREYTPKRVSRVRIPPSPHESTICESANCAFFFESELIQKGQMTFWINQKERQDRGSRPAGISSRSGKSMRFMTQY
jgi:hypothetical protein